MSKDVDGSNPLLANITTGFSTTKENTSCNQTDRHVPRWTYPFRIQTSGENKSDYRMQYPGEISKEDQTEKGRDFGMWPIFMGMRQCRKFAP